ncbi:stalk domain-containing protein [Bacillus sp. SCS-151]|uniref:stalk domain-containing protein n=1 Tax=Nanhaiella sioensis TaxID=3115293 RepID=UPI00397939B9
MRRSLYAILFLLITLSLALIILQWFSYTGNTEQKVMVDNNTQLNESIQLVRKDNALVVTQSYNGLVQPTYELSIPSVIEQEQIFCETENGKQCEIIYNDNDITLMNGNEQHIIFTYQISIDSSLHSFLMENWSINLHSQQLKNTRLEIIEDHSPRGTWVTGASLQKYISKENIDFYAWEYSYMDSPPIFWTNKQLDSEEVEEITYYVNEGNQVEKINAPSLARVPSSSPLTIVNIPGEDLVITPSLIIHDKDDGNFIEEGYIDKVLFESFSYDENDEWILQVLKSILLNRSVGDEFSNRLSEEMFTQLSGQALDEFIEIIFTYENKKLSSELLDRSLSAIDLGKTTFFSANTNQRNQTSSLYFVDERNFFINSKEIVNRPVIFRNGQLLFPLEDVLRQAGYKVSFFLDQETIYIEKGQDIWRFYLNKNYFIYNEEEWGLLSKPMEQIDHSVYIYETWLTDLFAVLVEKDEQTIDLTY